MTSLFPFLLAFMVWAVKGCTVYCVLSLCIAVVTYTETQQLGKLPKQLSNSRFTSIFVSHIYAHIQSPSPITAKSTHRLQTHSDRTSSMRISSEGLSVGWSFLICCYQLMYRVDCTALQAGILTLWVFVCVGGLVFMATARVFL